MPSLKLILYAALGFLALYVIWSLVDFGGDRTRNAIERQNHEAGNAADDARLDRHRCVDAGGVYHFDTGKCAGAEGDGG